MTKQRVGTTIADCVAIETDEQLQGWSYDFLISNINSLQARLLRPEEYDDSLAQLKRVVSEYRRRRLLTATAEQARNLKEMWESIDESSPPRRPFEGQEVCEICRYPTRGREIEDCGDGVAHIDCIARENMKGAY